MTNPTSGELSARAIFTAARAITKLGEREAFLDSQCGQDLQLRKIVAGMLVAPLVGDNPLDVFANAFGPSQTLDETHLGEPLKIDVASHPLIGPYKLLEQIGEGGMGTVFMAVQSQPIQRKVALKIIKPGMDTGQVIARFEAERQALAMMSHPNIAKVLDAGATDTGQPYFAMELVRGIPITQFCDVHLLDLRQRLEMFCTVCQAVQHAHQKGVIHRDLKPANILVEMQDVTPVPKVIDFGVAKSIHQPLTERTLHTGYAQMIGTPLYMSPEQTQLSSLDVDTRSDVYALGVLLYEMLTGSTPFDKEVLKQAGFDEMRRIIREDDPVKPSDRISTLAVASLSTISDQRKTEPRKLSHSIRGELDWIVMKALEKDRNRRYESAAALAADLQRYLEDQPVQACPPTVRYRMGKMLRRYRLPLAVAGSLVAAMAIGLVIAIWQARVAAVAEQQANDQRQKAESYLLLSLDTVDLLLKDVAEERLLNEPHMDPLRKRLLGDALEFCDALAREESDDPLVRLRTASAARRVAKISNRLGDPEEAINAGHHALELLGYPDPNLASDRQAVLESARAHAQIAISHRTLLKFDEAELAYRKGLELCRRSLLNSPTDSELQQELAYALRGLANLQSNDHKQDYDSSIATHSEAIEVWAELVRLQPDDVEHRSNLAAEFHNLANGFMATGKLSDAETQIRNAIREQELVVNKGAKLWSWEFLGNHHFLLSRILSQTNRFEQATDALVRCLEVRQKLWTNHPAVPSYQQSVANTHQELAYAWFFRSDFAKATESAALAVEQYEDLAKRFARYRVLLANALGTLAQVDPGVTAAGTTALEREIKIHKELHEESPEIPAYRFNLAGASSNLASIHSSNLEQGKAEQLYRSGLNLMHGLIKEYPKAREYHLRHTIIASNLAALLHETGRDTESVDMLREVHRVAHQMHKRWPEVSEYEGTYAVSASDLAWQLIRVGRVDEAQPLLDLAEPILHRHAADKPKAPFDYARARWGRAKLLLTRDPVAALGILQELTVVLRKLCQENPNRIELRSMLGQMYFNTVEIVSADTSRTAEERRLVAEPALKDGVDLYRQLLVEKGGEFVLQDLGAFVESAICLEHESFRQMLSDARAPIEKLPKARP